MQAVNFGLTCRLGQYEKVEDISIITIKVKVALYRVRLGTS